ncbi:enoyl-CoA hydratase/isomerase family protein [Nonomuraea salmonea]|uniref:enoyl-CoA hydratase/isomerase family protein n=1 Tax=Nonomuraea salmonea TaxID=46181 RepID=UPI0036213D41
MNELLVDRKDDGVVLITLNRTDMRNAMTDTMTAEWRAVMAELRDDRQARCLVVTGAGSAFSSGGDLSWIGERGTEAVPRLRDRMLAFYRTWLAITELEIPTIAAVNGPAVGAGLCVALACDLVYAADDAKLLAPFTSLGLHPGMAATYLLPKRAGARLAAEMLLTGRTVSGREASDKGLVNQSFPKNHLMSETEAIARKIAQNAHCHAPHQSSPQPRPSRPGSRADVGIPGSARDHGLRRHDRGPDRPSGKAHAQIHRLLII